MYFSTTKSLLRTQIIYYIIPITKNCNFLCDDGNQAGRPGMPSSHSAEVAFFSGFYYHQTTNPIIRSLLVIYAGLVMLSRYVKKCHTINQIGVGALLGTGLSWIVVRHL
jgi:membrane-associated phospholipid phosphatase